MDGRNDAPIEYRELRRIFNTARAVAAAVGVVAFAAAWWTIGLAVAPMVLGAFVIFVDGLWRRNRGTSPLAPILIDLAMVAMGVVLWGPSPAVQLASFLYVLTAALLLLPRRRAIGVVGLAVVVEALAFVPGGSGLVDDAARTAEVELGMDIAVGLLYTIVIGVLLFGAVRSFERWRERQREALETERRAVALKNEFVSMVSHELRTPLTGIAGFTDALREGWRDLPPDEVDEFLSIMRRETEHLANLVEDILVIPRLEAGRLTLRPEELNLVDVATEVCSLTLEGRKDFSIEVPADVDVVADPVRLRQILRNLCENARKYGGDQVLIEGEALPNGRYQVVVSDNGNGVPEGDVSRIFEHFEQLSKGDARLQQGVGLGLPIARKLAVAMGGDLWYEHRFPMGARFCFTVERAGASTAEEPEAVVDEDVNEAVV